MWTEGSVAAVFQLRTSRLQSFAQVFCYCVVILCCIGVTYDDLFLNVTTTSIWNIADTRHMYMDLLLEEVFRRNLWCQTKKSTINCAITTRNWLKNYYTRNWLINYYSVLCVPLFLSLFVFEAKKKKKLTHWKSLPWDIFH